MIISHYGNVRIEPHAKRELGRAVYCRPFLTTQRTTELSCKKHIEGMHGTTGAFHFEATGGNNGSMQGVDATL